MLVPSDKSSVVLLLKSSDPPTTPRTAVSTYAFVDSADGMLVAVAPVNASESSIAFEILASALAFV